MDYFNYRQQHLYVEDVSLQHIAEHYGTPAYVYSRATLERHWFAFDQALAGHDHLVCYAMKANSNLAVLNVLARLGSGFDIVSGGELERVLAAGGDANKIVFSGVGKTTTEILRALEVGIYCFNVESEAELNRLNQLAASVGKKARISLRVNPDVDAKSHPYISTGLKENKFGIDIQVAEAVYLSAAQMHNIIISGIDCHIGSQLTDTAPFIDALDRVLVLVDTLAHRGIELHHLDLGGGLGICYQHEQPPLPADYAKQIRQRLQGRQLKLLIEPGRAIAGNAGVLLTKVEYLKLTSDKNFAIVDAAMNDLLRPALYGAWQEIIPLQQTSSSPERCWDIVGPVCETADFLAKDRCLSIAADDILAIRSSGAYGFVMSSNYNSRPRAIEIMVDGEKIHVIRERERLADLFQHETVLPQ